MQDLGILAERLINGFPDYYGYFAQKEFLFDNRAPANTRNRNPLLSLGIGADGLKTGHTEEAGYGLTGSAAQGDRRIVFVITGLDSERARREESERLVNWAFRQFVEREIVTEGRSIATADVWLGEDKTVDLVTGEGRTMLIPAMEQDNVVAEARFDSPLQAPIAKGEKMGTLVIEIDGLPDTEVPLIAASAVAKGGFVPRMKTAAGVLMAMALEDGDTAPETAEAAAE